MPPEAGGSPEETAVVATVVEPVLVDPLGSVVVVAKVVDPVETLEEALVVLAADEEAALELDEAAEEEEEEEPAGTEASPLTHDELLHKKRKSVMSVLITSLIRLTGGMKKLGKEETHSGDDWIVTMSE